MQQVICSDLIRKPAKRRELQGFVGKDRKVLPERGAVRTCLAINSSPKMRSQGFRPIQSSGYRAWFTTKSTINHMTHCYITEVRQLTGRQLLYFHRLVV